MVQEDWLMKGISESRIPEKIMAMWEPILWGAENLDLVLKIMGKTACEEEEQTRIKQRLYKKHQYEWLGVMTYAKCYQRQQMMENGIERFHLVQEKGRVEFSDNALFYKEEEQESVSSLLPQYQFLSFLRWCDKKDWEDIFEKPSVWEWYRLCYLAFMVGYQSLALYFVRRIGKQIGKEEIAVLEKYGKKLRLLQRKWILDFYRKQPEGKEKKRLAKRILRYGIRS